MTSVGGSDAGSTTGSASTPARPGNPRSRLPRVLRGRRRTDRRGEQPQRELRPYGLPCSRVSSAAPRRASRRTSSRRTSGRRTKRRSWLRRAFFTGTSPASGRLGSESCTRALPCCANCCGTRCPEKSSAWSGIRGSAKSWAARPTARPYSLRPLCLGCSGGAIVRPGQCRSLSNPSPTKRAPQPFQPRFFATFSSTCTVISSSPSAIPSSAAVRFFATRR